VDTLEAVARRIVGVLDSLGAPYAMMGGLAVRLYALPRATYDADIITSIALESLPTLFAEAEKAGFTVSSPQKTGWVDTVRDFSVVKLQWCVDSRSIDVDLFLVESPFQREILARRRLARANGWQAWFVSVEDLILLKLMAGRRKDLADVADILLVQGPLDEAYLHAWAERLKVADGLRQALSERPA
jgi:predicted nucleotidyltransferase